MRNTFINFLAELDEKVVTTKFTLNVKLELAAGIVVDLLILLGKKANKSISQNVKLLLCI